MEANLLLLLVAGSVAMLVFGAVQVVKTLLDPDRRKLQDRLTTESKEGGFRRGGGDSFAARSIRLESQNKGLSAQLAQVPLLASIARRVKHAYPDLSLVAFLLFIGSLALAGFAIVWSYFDSLLIGAIAGAVGGYLPFLVINAKRNKRQQVMAIQLPEALDFLSRILKAGHSLSTGLQMMADELAKPLADEFRRAYDQHSLGMSMDDTLKDMATRIESTDFAFFVTAVLIQRQTGGDLSEVLNNISSMIRQRIRLQQHVRAKTAEGRFTGYILSGFPVVMFALVSVLNPANASVLWKTEGGLIMLCTAFGLTLMGLLFIKKLTTVRV